MGLMAWWKGSVRQDVAPLSFDLLVYGAVFVAILVAVGTWKLLGL